MVNPDLDRHGKIPPDALLRRAHELPHRLWLAQQRTSNPFLERPLLRAAAVEVDPIHPGLNQLGRVRQMNAVVGRELDDQSTPRLPRAVAGGGRVARARLGGGVKLLGLGGGAGLDEVESTAFC